MLSRKRKTCALGARKTKNENVIKVMGKICKDWGQEDRTTGRRVGKGLSLEGIILPFANIYPVSCIHCEEYASPAFKKLVFKLGRQLWTSRRVNLRQNGTNELLKRKKIDFLLRNAYL